MEVLDTMKVSSKQMDSSQQQQVGYISEKLYLLLQLYLQNKSWNPSVELLQCFTELKDAAMLPSAAYLQMVANRVTLDSQGRLVLRDNGKIILPFEHFANAVMLKHMNGPHGMHLGVDATIRAVMESYTVGRDNFGMEREFIMEVVQSCPSPPCRFYKSVHMEQLSHKHYHSESPASKRQEQKFSKNSSSHHHQHSSVPHTGGGGFSAADVSTASFPSSVTSAVDLTERMPTPVSRQGSLGPPPQPPADTDQADKLADFLRANFDTLEGVPGAKDFLALQNGVWPMFETDKRTTTVEAGQEKIVRTFSEIMKNMSRMKTCVRPSMCKPYGKQSEALQKTLVDTIQLVQSLRSFLPPPHITVTSWKEEEHKHRPGSKSSLRTLGKPPDVSSSGSVPVLPPGTAALLADSLHLVRPKNKFE